MLICETGRYCDDCAGRIDSADMSAQQPIKKQR